MSPSTAAGTGWSAPCTSPAARRPKPTVLLLYDCPGLEKNLDLAAALRDRGRNALVFHYRGCWGSEGPSHKEER